MQKTSGPSGINLDKLTFYLSLIFLLPGIYSFFYKVRLGFKVNSSKFYGPHSKTINFDSVNFFPNDNTTCTVWYQNNGFQLCQTIHQDKVSMVSKGK